MAVFKVPREMASGFLTIGGVDLTTHVRQVETEEDQPTIDLGTVSDPSATALGRLGREVTVEFLNSFADGTTDGLYDELDALADGAEKAVIFQPFGSGTAFPKWEWTTDVGFAPMGSFEPDAANIVSLTLPVRSLAYTKAV
jgi:hypothetical protein